MSATNLAPTYHGYIGSTKDALLIIYQALNQQLELVPRRPHERERPELIKSGNVFVFIEEHSGIKRWTDGTSWSPSRILGRFLVYRELDKSGFTEKDDKKKKKRKSSLKYDQSQRDGTDSSSTGSNSIRDGDSASVSNAQLQQPRPAMLTLSSTQSMREQQVAQELIPPNTIPASNTYSSADYNKSLLSGPLVTSYVFKDQGLIKKTLSLTTTTSDLHLDKLNERQTIHLISYYNAQEVMNGKLLRPSESDFKDVVIPASLWTAVKDSSLGGKIPIEDEAFYFLDGNYQLQSMLQLQLQLQQQQQPTHQQRQPLSILGAGVGGGALTATKLSYGKYGGPLSQQPQQFQPRLGQQLPMGMGPQNQHQSEMLLVKRDEEDNAPAAVNDLNFINPFSGTQQQVPIYGSSLGFMSNNGNTYNYLMQGQGQPHGQGQGYPQSQYNQFLQHNPSQMNNTPDGYPQHFHPGYPQSQLQPQLQLQLQHSFGHQHQSTTFNASSAFQPPLPQGSTTKPSTSMQMGMVSGTNAPSTNASMNPVSHYRLNSGSSVDQYSIGNNNSVSSITSGGMHPGGLSNTTSTSSVLTANSSFSGPAGSRKFSQQSSGGQVPTMKHLKPSNFTPMGQGFGATSNNSNTVTPSASLSGVSTEGALAIPQASSSDLDASLVHPGQFMNQYPQQQHHQLPQQLQPQVHPQHQYPQHPHQAHYQLPHQQQLQKWSNSPQQNQSPHLQQSGNGNGNGHGTNGAGFEDVTNSTAGGTAGQQSSYYPTSLHGQRF